MKYIEELKYGQLFLYNKAFYLLSADFKQKKHKNQHMCIELNSGLIQWLDSDTIIDNIPIFYQDSSNTLHNIEQPYDNQTDS
jgi:hypothetical protein